MRKLLEIMPLFTTLSLPSLAIAQEIEEEHTRIQGELGLIVGSSPLPIRSELSAAFHGHGAWATGGSVHGGMGVGLKWKADELSLELVPAELHLECEAPGRAPCEWGYGLEAGLENSDWGLRGNMVFHEEGVGEGGLNLRWRGVTVGPYFHHHEEEGHEEKVIGARFSVQFQIGENMHLIPGVDWNPEQTTLAFSVGLGPHIHP